MFDLERDCCELPLRDFDADEVIIREGMRQDTLFVLVEGEVEVTRSGVAVARLDQPGEIFGEVSVLLGRPTIAEVRAVSPCRFRVAEDAEQFLRDHPEANVALARALAEKLDALGSYLVDLKRQYGSEANHFGMVGEVLDSLLHQR